MLRSIRKLVGRGTLLLGRSASESCPLLRRGTEKDLGLDGSEDIMLVKGLDEGSNNLINGLVIKPNTCIDKEKGHAITFIFFIQ